MKPSAILCSFSVGLDSLPRKDHREVVPVLRVLQAAGRFSCFEASATLPLARTMTYLMHERHVVRRSDGTVGDYGRLIESTGGRYPWTTIRVTEGGERLLKESEPAVSGKTA